MCKYLILFLTFGLLADTYWVEVDLVTKEQKSSYILKDGEDQENCPKDRAQIEITQAEYEAISHSTLWKVNYENWLKIQKNADKVNAGIAARIAKVEHDAAVEVKLKEIVEAQL